MASPGIAIAAVGRAPSPPARRRACRASTGTSPRRASGRARARRRGRPPSPSCTGCASASAGSARRAASGRGPAMPPSRGPSPPASRRSGCASSPPSRIGPQPSPPRGCPTASSGRRSTPTCAAAGLVVAGGQGKWTGRSSGSGTWARSGSTRWPRPCASWARRSRPRVRGGRRPAPPAPPARPSRPRPPPRSVTGRSPQRLVLVRHGVTDWNREGRWQGRLDPPLSDDRARRGEPGRGARRGRPGPPAGTDRVLDAGPREPDRDDHRPGGRRRGRARVAPRRDRRRGVGGAYPRGARGDRR